MDRLVILGPCLIIPNHMKLITSLSDSHVSWACFEDHNKSLCVGEENKKVNVGGDVGVGLIVALC